MAAENACRLSVTVRPACDGAEVEAAQALRIRVFCDEQWVARELELDGLDDEALHIVAVDESGVIAACRLRFPERAVARLERMAVERRFRGLGVGAALLGGAEAKARGGGAAEVVLNGQVRAEPFYAAHGYVAEGESFVEAGIEHTRMRKGL